MYTSARKNLGFTIVELLVVIVVIAVLAAITTLAFRYIQARAYDSKMTAGFNQYGKVLDMYYDEKGGYPFAYDASRGGYVCLGEESHYPAVGGWESGACYGERQSDGSISTSAKIDAGLVTSLSQYVTVLPDVSYKEVDISGGSGVFMRGPWFLSTHPRQYMVIYYGNYSGPGGGNACMWGGQINQFEQYGMEACSINKFR